MILRVIQGTSNQTFSLSAGGTLENGEIASRMHAVLWGDLPCKSASRLANRLRFAKHSPANGRRASGTNPDATGAPPAIEGMAVRHRPYCPIQNQLIYL